LKYAFESSWQARGVKLLLILVCLLDVVLIANCVTQSRSSWSVEKTLIVIWGIVLLVCIWRLWRGKLKVVTPAWILSALAPGYSPAFAIIMYVLFGSLLWSIVASLVGIVNTVIIAVACKGADDGNDDDANTSAFVIGGVVTGIGAGIGIIIIIIVVASIVTDIAGIGAGVGVGFVAIVVACVVIFASAVAGGIVTITGAFGFGVNSLHHSIGSIGRNTVGLVVDVVRNTIGDNNSAFFKSTFFDSVGGVFLGAIIVVFVGLCIGISNIFLMYFPTSLLYHAGGGFTAALVWIIYFASLGSLLWYGKTKQRRSRNPLHGLLTKQGQAITKHPSRLPFFSLPWFKLQHTGLAEEKEKTSL
jgi:hypothetical protein